MNITNELNAVLTLLANVHNINSGGCGIAALVARDYLEKHTNVTMYGIVSEAYKWCYKDDGIDYVYEHIVIKIENKYYDSEGEFLLTNHTRHIAFLEKIEREDIIHLLSVDSWNNIFDRDDIVPVIKKLNLQLTIPTIR